MRRKPQPRSGQASVVSLGEVYEEAAREASVVQGVVSTPLHGLTPAKVVIVGTGGTLHFGSEFNLPRSFTAIAADGGVVLHCEKPTGRHFGDFCYEAAEVARCIAAGRTETARLRLSSTPSPPLTGPAPPWASVSRRRGWRSEGGRRLNPPLSFSQACRARRVAWRIRSDRKSVFSRLAVGKEGQRTPCFRSRHLSSKTISIR